MHLGHLCSELPQAQTTLTTNDIVISKLTQILSYLRQGTRNKKLKKKDKGEPDLCLTISHLPNHYSPKPKPESSMQFTHMSVILVSDLMQNPKKISNKKDNVCPDLLFHLLHHAACIPCHCITDVTLKKCYRFIF